MNFKTGKLAPKVHSRTLAFGKYLTGTLPAPAAKVYREYKVPQIAKQMFGNDKAGDCTCAYAANHLILNTCHTGIVTIPVLRDVIDMYIALTGYDPRTGANDNGVAITDMLEYLRTVGLSGHKILAWAQIDHTDAFHRKAAIDLFDGTCVGVQLPDNAENQFDADQPFELVPGHPGEDGHCILRTGYGSDGGNYVTWANWEQKASNAWDTQYVDEEYVVITQDWINQATKKTPGGLDLDTLLADIALLKQ